MKWLSGGLTFFNAATFLALIMGILEHGLSRTLAGFCIIGALVIGFLAYWTTADVPLRVRRPKQPWTPPESKSKRAQRREAKQGIVVAEKPSGWKYRSFWFWVLAICFGVFAFRSFCWLIYWDGNDVKVQSPNNLGDLSLHLTYIRHFASGVALWPDNPIEPFSKLRYPAGVDLFNAVLTCLNVDVIKGLVWVAILSSIATFYALYRWGGNFGIAGFLFNGGLASFPVLTTFNFLDYQGANNMAWKSIALSMFVTQRGVLYAFPVALLLLYQWRARFFPDYAEPALVATPEEDRPAIPPTRGGPLPFWVELSLYATMPLYHAHTFMALSLALALLFFLGEGDARKKALLLVGLAILPATFCVWITTDYFHASSFIKWQPGWVQSVPKGDMAMPFVRFWLVNFGAWVPLVLFFVGITVLSAWKSFYGSGWKLPARLLSFALALVIFVAIKPWEFANLGLRVICYLAILVLIAGLAMTAWQAWKTHQGTDYKIPASVGFLIPAIAIFLVGYLVKLAPWEWDNIKIIVWAYLIILPFLWTDLIIQWPIHLRVLVYIALFASGFVSLCGGIAIGKNGYGIANREELDAIGVAVHKLPAEARYAGWPTWGHPVLLQGRKMVLGYPGHLWTQGFKFDDTNNKLKAMMEGAPNWKDLARTLHARYVFWGREEKANYAASKRPWERESALMASGPWGAIYDIEAPASASVRRQ
jgi:hypothetical protein